MAFDPASIVTLRVGGQQLPAGALAGTMFVITDLSERDPLTFYELVMICRDPSHEPYGSTGERLRKLSLLQENGKPHDLTRDIVLSATEGDLMDLHLVSPISN